MLPIAEMSGKPVAWMVMVMLGGSWYSLPVEAQCPMLHTRQLLDEANIQRTVLQAFSSCYFTIERATFINRAASAGWHSSLETLSKHKIWHVGKIRSPGKMLEANRLCSAI